jgi:hypothetical protein
MQDHYDFSKGTPGKYAMRYKAGANIVLLDPDVTKEFADDASVNEALRAFLRLKKNSPDKPT